MDAIQQAYFDGVEGIILNPAAYTHTSVALMDALKAVAIPTVEVHISDVAAREDFRQVSYVRPACIATVTGRGFAGYLDAMDILLKGRRSHDRDHLSRTGGGHGGSAAVKSCAHRMLLCGALAEGRASSRASPPVRTCWPPWTASAPWAARAVWRAIRPASPAPADISAPAGTYPCRESGSTLRFCIPAALLQGGSAAFTGTRG